MSTMLLVMSNANPGAEKAYAKWYEERHLTDMVALDGVAGGAIHRLVDATDEARWRFAALYELTEPVSDVLAAIFDRAGSNAMPLTDTIDGASVLMLAVEALGDRRLAANEPDRGDALRFIVLTNATAGEDAAFNSWYDGRHLDDVIAIPGFVAAQRFRVAPETAGKASPWRYLAIYEIAPEAAEAALAELGARAGSEAMPLSPTLDRDVYTGLFAAIREVPA